MTEDNIFYTVSDEYVDYLLKIESHVMQNKPQERTYHRKYVGILTEINGLNILFRCHLQRTKIMRMEKSKRIILRQYIFEARKNCTVPYALTA